MVRHYFSLQDIKISFKDVDFYAKLNNFEYPSQKLKNPVDHTTYTCLLAASPSFAFLLFFSAKSWGIFQNPPSIRTQLTNKDH